MTNINWPDHRDRLAKNAKTLDGALATAIITKDIKTDQDARDFVKIAHAYAATISALVHAERWVQWQSEITPEADDD